MSDPKNATLNGEGFRFYRWTEPDGQEYDLLSVTSIRTLCGEGYQLVNWKMANLADAALGTMKREVIGPRGGHKEVRQVWEYPSEFAQKYVASEGEQGKIDLLRKWLRESADEPRNIAARRGTMTHEAIEKNVAWDRIERPYVEAAFARLSDRDRKAAKKGVTDEDVYFVRNSVRQYWDFRASLPIIILGREVQVFNLTAGYGGSADALVWLLGDYNEADEFVALPVAQAAEAHSIPWHKVTVEDVRRIGGTLILLDWKTAKDLHTDNVVQAHAYLAAEFAGSDGTRNERLTALLEATMYGGLVHIRPNKWKLCLFDFKPEVVRAFLGSVAFARFLAKYPQPTPIWAATMSGQSAETEGVTDDETD